MRVLVLIPAAGCGRRFGAEKKKQYLELFGQPVLVHAIRLFDCSPFVDEIVLIAPPGELEFCRHEMVERYGFRKVGKVVCGGDERQASVYNGLLACGARAEDIILVHDGVRPFLPVGLLETVVRKAQGEGACLVAVPARDTLKEVEDGRVVRTPDRERYWLAQTPQAFRFDIIWKAHRKAHDEGFHGTDDASLVERMGMSVPIVEGSRLNFKITTPEDLMVAHALASVLKEGHHS